MEWLEDGLLIIAFVAAAGFAGWWYATQKKKLK